MLVGLTSSRSGIRVPRLGLVAEVSGDVSPPFVPTEVSLEFWHDATQLEGFVDDDPVTSFADFTGNGRALAGAVENAAVFKEAGINSLPAVLGDGAASSLSFDGLGSFGTWWFVIVFKSVAMSFQSNGANIFSIADYPASPGLFILLNKSSANNVQVFSGLGSTSPEVPAGDGVPRALIVVGNGSHCLIKSDDGTIATASGALTTPGVTVRAFARGDGNYANVMIGEDFFVNGEFPVDRETAIWTYLSRWGTSIPTAGGLP